MNLLIGALLLNPSNRVSEGSKVNGIYRLAVIILGDFAIGSIVDAVGSYVLGGTISQACVHHEPILIRRIDLELF